MGQRVIPQPRLEMWRLLACAVAGERRRRLNCLECGYGPSGLECGYRAFHGQIRRPRLCPEGGGGFCLQDALGSPGRGACHQTKGASSLLWVDWGWAKFRSRLLRRPTEASFIHVSMHAFIHSFIHPYIHPFIHPTCFLSTFCMLGIIPKGLKMELVAGLQHLDSTVEARQKTRNIVQCNFQNCQVL